MLATSSPELTPGQEQSQRSIRGHIVFCFGIILLLALAWKLSKELEILYVSALFAAVLMPIVTHITTFEFQGRRPSRPAAIFLLIVAVALIVAVFFIVGLPPVLRDFTQFSTELPTRIPHIVGRIKKLPGADRLGVEVIAQRAEGAI